MQVARAILALLVATMPLATTASMPAQQSNAAPGPANNDARDLPGAVVFRQTVRRVPVDIVVTDKQGNPVKGLKQEDFTVKEDKVEQQILSFEYVNNTAPSFIPPKLPPLPVNTYINLPSAPEQGPLYILYYDMVNTEQEEQMAFHHQLLDFVDKTQPGTRIALFVNAYGLHLLQGFTNDHALLKTAILSKGPGPHMPQVFLDGRNYGHQDVGAAISNLNFLADYLAGIPGRKNLIWLAGKFPIPFGPTAMLTSAPDDVMIKQTFAALLHSEVAVYPIDVRGVPLVDERSGDAKASYSVTSVDQTQQENIANSTGGRAFYGNNRVNELMDKAIDHGGNYYSISYSPTNNKYDGSERKIEITLAKDEGYTLSYRRLYFSIPENGPPPIYDKKNIRQAQFVAAKAEDTLYANIEHGAPMLHDLLFSAHLDTVGAPVLANAQQMAELVDSPAFFRTRHKDKPLAPLPPVKLQKYAINYGIVDPQLKAQARLHGAPATLEFAAAAYDADGRLLNSILNEGQASADAAAAGKSGALFHAAQELEVPPGAAWLRVAVRDKLTNRTGTLEVALPLKTDTSPLVANKGE